MSRTRLAALTLLALAACGRGEKSDVASADSLNRDLQLAPVDTTAELNDQPGADTATVATATPAPAPAPKPAAEAQAQAETGRPGAGPGGRGTGRAGTGAGSERPRRRHHLLGQRRTPRSARTRTRWVTRSRPPWRRTSRTLPGGW